MDLVTSYKQFLSLCFPQCLPGYERRLASAPDSARSEAAIYWYLDFLGYQIEPEDPSHGGPDFQCSLAGKLVLVVEVASLEDSTVVGHAGFDPAKKIGQFVVPVCDVVLGRMQSKVQQLKGHPCPRILALTGSHVLAHLVMLGDAVEEILVGELEQLVDPVSRVSRTGTRFRNSVFLQQRGGAPQPCRQYASGLLLCHVSGRSLELAGVRHPEPAMPADLSGVFPDVPFVELARWPVAQSPLTIHWRRCGAAIPGSTRRIPYP